MHDSSTPVIRPRLAGFVLAIVAGFQLAMVPTVARSADVASDSGGASGTSAVVVAYRWPVDVDQPVATFDAPTTPYGPGHRGVDLLVQAGQPVHAMADGTISFAGTVAGQSWVTVLHADGVRTSYGPLQPRRLVHLGAAVAAGQVVGLASGTAHGQSGLLHVGARAGHRYVDPAVLVGATPERLASLEGPGLLWVPRGDAAARPVLVPGTPPSPNRLIVLPGLTSRTGYRAFDLEALGYPKGRWEQFSYLGVDDDGAPLPYGPDATWERVHELALALQGQLRAHQQVHPGEAVDLLGHSLGGLVAMYYLLVLHDATDPSLPPIGNAITVASPLRGTASADAIARVRRGALGRTMIEGIERFLPYDDRWQTPIVHGGIPVLEDLQTGSDVADAVQAAWARSQQDPWSSPLATGTRVMNLSTMLDPVVTAHHAHLPGAEGEMLFDRNPILAHDRVTKQARTEELLTTFLAREPLPERGLQEHAVNLGGGLVSRAIAGGENLVARAWDGLHRPADLVLHLLGLPG